MELNHFDKKAILSQEKDALIAYNNQLKSEAKRISVFNPEISRDLEKKAKELSKYLGVN